MRIAVLCATQRGFRFVQQLIDLAPRNELVVFSFREDPWEPPFLDDIREFTVANGGEFYETRQVGSPRWKDFWESTPVDLMFAVSWRYMIPSKIYQRPRLGTFVFHDSLLPEYRGFSPTVWSIINGEDHTAVTLFEIAEGVDEGEIVAQQRVPIGPDDRIGVVLERVTEAYLRLLEKNLDALMKGTAPRYPQDHTLATYTSKRLPEDNRIDWVAATVDIYNLVRAVSVPYPGAYTTLSGKRLRIWAAEQIPDARPYIGRVPGAVVAVHTGKGSEVLTGDGSLLVTNVQFEDDEPVCAAEVLNSLSLRVGR